MLTQLRRPRYLRLAALMLLIATICVAAGTWQIQRLIEKHDANKLLRGNALGPSAPVQDVLAPLSSATAVARTAHAKFRSVTATGVYLPAAQTLVREQTVNDTVGFLVLVPLRVRDGRDLLIVRGFVPAQGEQAPQVPAPPAGTVTVQARVEPADTANDEFGRVPGQIRTVNVARLAARLHIDPYAGYAELLARQPGTAGLTVIPDPDLSNAAGGAIEPQHVAYIIQWYLFALIALAAPLAMARADAQRQHDAAERRPGRTDPWAALDDVSATDAVEPPSPESQVPQLSQAARASQPAVQQAHPEAEALPPRLDADRMAQRYGGARRL